MDLCAHRPEYFQCFKSEISKPDVIEQIPLVKTLITAVCAMDINNFTVSGNIWAVIDLLSQGGIYCIILNMRRLWALRTSHHMLYSFMVILGQANVFKLHNCVSLLKPHRGIVSSISFSFLACSI